MDPRDADPLVLIEDRERPLVTVPNPGGAQEWWSTDYGFMVRDYRTGDVDLGTDGVVPLVTYRRTRRLAIIALVAAAFLAGFIVRAALATPRAAPQPAMSFEDVPTVATQPGVPPLHHAAFGPDSKALAGGAPSPTSGIGSPLEGRHGVIAQARGHGSDYLAIPIGPGHLVRICGPAACLTLRSTDGGPNHAMLVAGRIADVALGHWLTICGLPKERGTCVGHWETTDMLPATDTE